MRRPQLEQADWHVTARGARRLLLFHDAADYKTFYDLLGEACQHANVQLIADCLMSNHFHLALSGSTDSLGRCMQRLNHAYSVYHNDRYELSGHAFDQVYYGAPIPSGFILKRVVRYIHLNPVRAGKVSGPNEYPWSSYTRLINADGKVLSVAEHRLLDLFDTTLRTAQQRYREFVDRDTYRKASPVAGRTPVWELWDVQFGWILDHAIEQQALIAPVEPELAAIYLGSRIGIPPRAMGKHLGHEDGRLVSEMIRSLKRRFEHSPTLALRIDALNVL